MERETARNRAMALAALRVTIGILSMMLAWHKIFVTGLAQEMKWFADLGQWFPNEVLWAVNIYAAVVELIGGFLLCIGFKRDWAAWGILSVLVIVTFGHSLEAEVWDIQQMVFRLGLLCAFLMAPSAWDVLRLETVGKARALFLTGKGA